MKKIVLFLIIPFILNACALCSISIPKVTANIDFSIKNEVVTNMHAKWTFGEKFTLQILPNYDENGNDKLDKAEVQDMQEVLMTYITPRNLLTELSIYTPTSSKNILLVAKNHKLIYDNKQLYFDFDIPLSIELKNGSTLKLVFEDREGFFDFKIDKFEDKKIGENLFIKSNTNLNAAFFKIVDENAKVASTKQISNIEQNKTQNIKQNIEQNKTQNIEENITQSKTQSIKQNTEQNKTQNIAQKANSSYINILRSYLKTYSDKIKVLLKDIKKESSFSSMLLLILFSFLYGLFHALGPGHGKTLVASYFLANGGGWHKALSMSIRIGVIHVAGAFALVITSMYIIQTFISKTLGDTALYTSYISATIIIFISLSMLYKKMFAKKKHAHNCSCCSHKPTPKRGWLVAVAAGIVPCPGTVMIFIMTLVLGNYLSGFLSAIAMSLGMSSVIFISSMLAQYIHTNASEKFHNFFFIIEYIAIFIMLFLGVILIISPVTI
ncbi:MAG: DUF1007 family protein [Sulfurimonas sp.]|nr:DUF1007 family protein [Sulfurimonas sp.]